MLSYVSKLHETSKPFGHKYLKRQAEGLYIWEFQEEEIPRAAALKTFLPFQLPAVAYLFQNEGTVMQGA